MRESAVWDLQSMQNQAEKAASWILVTNGLNLTLNSQTEVTILC